MILIDEKVLDKYRGPGVCCLCHKSFQVLDVHHVQACGLGGGHRIDATINCVGICRSCHSLKADSAEGREKCINAICIRECCTQENRQAVIDFLNRLDGKVSETKIAERLVAELDGRAFEMAETALIGAGKLTEKTS